MTDIIDVPLGLALIIVILLLAGWAKRKWGDKDDLDL